MPVLESDTSNHSLKTVQPSLGVEQRIKCTSSIHLPHQRHASVWKMQYERATLSLRPPSLDPVKLTTDHVSVTKCVTRLVFRYLHATPGVPEGIWKQLPGANSNISTFRAVHKLLPVAFLRQIYFLLFCMITVYPFFIVCEGSFSFLFHHKQAISTICALLFWFLLQCRHRNMRPPVVWCGVGDFSRLISNTLFPF